MLRFPSFAVTFTSYFYFHVKDQLLLPHSKTVDSHRRWFVICGPLIAIIVHIFFFIAANTNHIYRLHTGRTIEKEKDCYREVKLVLVILVSWCLHSVNLNGYPLQGCVFSSVFSPQVAIEYLPLMDFRNNDSALMEDLTRFWVTWLAIRFFFHTNCTTQVNQIWLFQHLSICFANLTTCLITENKYSE